MESSNTPADLVGQVVGPVDVAITNDRVSLYADVTGDDVARWTDEAPPGFGSVLLFAVADEFLYHPKTIEFTATLMHVDQSFTYVRPMRVGSVQTVEGTVTRVRERAGSFFVTFEYQRQKLVIATAFFQHDIIGDELLSGLCQQYLVAKLDRSTTPATLDQFRVRLKDAEHFVAVGDLFAIEHPSPSDLGHLLHRIDAVCQRGAASHQVHAG